jgi:hypothetical protein
MQKNNDMVKLNTLNSKFGINRKNKYAYIFLNFGVPEIMVYFLGN